MTDDEFVTEEQVARWLPQDVRRALSNCEHDWIELTTLGRSDVLHICKRCHEQEWVQP